MISIVKTKAFVNIIFCSYRINLGIIEKYKQTDKNDSCVVKKRNTVKSSGNTESSMG